MAPPQRKLGKTSDTAGHLAGLSPPSRSTGLVPREH